MYLKDLCPKRFVMLVLECSRARGCCLGDEEDPLLPDGGDSGVKFPIDDIGRGGVFARS